MQRENCSVGIGNALCYGPRLWHGVSGTRRRTMSTDRVRPHISHFHLLVQRRGLDYSARRGPRFREKRATDREDSYGFGRGQATSCVRETPVTRRTQRDKWL
jgi:hypothetical protein